MSLSQADPEFHKPHAGWEAVLANMAERGAAANRERADAAERRAEELRAGFMEQ